MIDAPVPAVLIRPVTAEDHASEAALVHAAYAAGPYRAALAADPAWVAAERDSAGRDAAGRVLVAVPGGGSGSGTGSGTGSGSTPGPGSEPGPRTGSVAGAGSAADAAGADLSGSITVVRGGTPYAKLAVEGEVELRFLAVAPEARGAGVATALIRAGVELALRWGATVVRLDTGVRNPAAALYERLGFTRTPEFDARLDGLSHGASLSYALELQERADVRVREIVAPEIPAVSELVLAAYRDDYARLPGDYLAEIANVAERAAEHLVWVAEDAATGELLGTITTPLPGTILSDVARPGEMDLRLLGVGHAARGRGIGSLIMRHGIRLAGIRGVRRLVLRTSTEMVAAYQLYDRMGFERLPEREEDVTRADGSQFRLLAYGIDVAAEPRPDSA